MGKLDGGCLCGRVTYRCAAEPVATAACHCRDCQKSTGTSFSVVVAVPLDSLEIEGDSLASFTTVGTDTGKDVERRFCRECGSPVMSVPAGLPGIALIKAGTLDDASWLEPQLHAWTDSAQPWVELGEDVTKLPRGVPAQ
jgi:hypothetical protein